MLDDTSTPAADKTAVDYVKAATTQAKKANDVSLDKGDDFDVAWEALMVELRAVATARGVTLA